jgi:hypothetical protein
LNPEYFDCFTFIFILCGESHLLVSWCVGCRCDKAGTYEDHGRSRRPDADDRRWSNTGRVFGDQTIGRLGDAVCGLHHAQGDEGAHVPWLSLKTKVDDLSVVCPQNN